MSVGAEVKLVLRECTVCDLVTALKLPRPKAGAKQRELLSAFAFILRQITSIRVAPTGEMASWRKRAYLLDADYREGKPIRGRVQHVRSGDCIRSEDVHELLDFLIRSLTISNREGLIRDVCSRCNRPAQCEVSTR